MKTNYITAAIILLVLILIGAGIFSVYKNRSAQTTMEESSPVPLSSPQESFSKPSPSASSTVPGPGIQPVSGQSDNKNNEGIAIVEPQEKEQLTYPFRVMGYRGKATGDVQITVSDSSGKLIDQITTPCKADADPAICQFSALFDIAKPQAADGIIMVNSGALKNSLNIKF